MQGPVKHAEGVEMHQAMERPARLSGWLAGCNELPGSQCMCIDRSGGVCAGNACNSSTSSHL
jgi:hypothetical protein